MRYIDLWWDGHWRNNMQKWRLDEGFEWLRLGCEYFRGILSKKRTWIFDTYCLWKESSSVSPTQDRRFSLIENVKVKFQSLFGIQKSKLDGHWIEHRELNLENSNLVVELRVYWICRWYQNSDHVSKPNRDPFIAIKMGAHNPLPFPPLSKALLKVKLLTALGHGLILGLAATIWATGGWFHLSGRGGTAATGTADGGCGEDNTGPVNAVVIDLLGADGIQAERGWNDFGDGGAGGHSDRRGLDWASRGNISLLGDTVGWGDDAGGGIC